MHCAGCLNAHEPLHMKFFSMLEDLEGFSNASRGSAEIVCAELPRAEIQVSSWLTIQVPQMVVNEVIICLYILIVSLP